MDRWGNGNASSDENTGSPGDQPSGGERLTGTPYGTDMRAREIAELSRRAVSAHVHLLAYVDELEEEVRRLRRHLGHEATDGTA